MCWFFFVVVHLSQIHFHLPNSSTLDEFVPRDLLPNDYGGRAGFVADLKRDFVAQIHQHRDYLLDETRWRLVVPTKKNGQAGDETTAAAGLNENFETLCID